MVNAPRFLRDRLVNTTRLLAGSLVDTAWVPRGTRRDHHARHNTTTTTTNNNNDNDSDTDTDTTNTNTNTNTNNNNNNNNNATATATATTNNNNSNDTVSQQQAPTVRGPPRYGRGPCRVSGGVDPRAGRRARPAGERRVREGG